MAFKIKIPLTSKQPSETFQNDLKSVSPSMINKYGSFFRAAGVGTNIPVQVLYTIDMIESTGNHFNDNGSVYVSGSERSTGIMQISPSSLYEALKFEIRKDRLTPESQVILKKYVPSFKFKIGESIPPTPSKAVLDLFFNALKSPEFNIWASAIVFRKLLEDTVGLDNTMRLDKAIVKYNVGEYSKPTKTTTFKIGDTTQLINSLNPITSTYIVKAVGKNGALYYFIKNNIV